MEDVMQRFHGTAARQLVLIGDRPETAAMFARKPAPARLRLMQKDLYAELTRRRRQAQIAARKYVEDRRP
jgi:hypothetical protein